jgi:hypothetical protein
LISQRFSRSFINSGARDISIDSIESIESVISSPSIANLLQQRPADFQFESGLFSRSAKNPPSVAPCSRRFFWVFDLSFCLFPKQMPLTTQHRLAPQGLDCLRQQQPGGTRKVSLSTKATTRRVLRNEAFFRKAFRVASKAVVAQARATQSERFIQAMPVAT